MDTQRVIDNLACMKVEILDAEDVRINTINTAIVALKEMQNRTWIPVSERLPNVETTFLVAWAPSDMDVYNEYKHYYGLFEYNLDDKCFEVDVHEIYNEVTCLAWMPLPEPYQTE